MKDQLKIRVADASLNDRTITIGSEAPTGYQILVAASLEPPDEHLLFAMLPHGDFDEVRLSEKYDLAGRYVDRFIAFRSDRAYRLLLDGRQLSWGEPKISGAILKKLAGVGDTHDVVMTIAAGQPVVIADHDTVDVDKTGVEHLTTRPRPITIIVNGTRKTVQGNSITFEALIALAFPNPPNGDGIQFTVQFTRGPEDKPTGALVNGQSVHIKNGMEFDVTSTNRS